MDFHLVAGSHLDSSALCCRAVGLLLYHSVSGFLEGVELVAESIEEFKISRLCLGKAGCREMQAVCLKLQTP